MSMTSAIRGQALTEYLVVATALVFALWVPFGNAPVAQQLLDALARTYRNYSFVVALS
jgi:hypothetical protein